MSFRTDESASWRAKEVLHRIDAGFVHIRRLQTILGQDGMKFIDSRIRVLPAELPDWERDRRIHRIYCDAMLEFCRVNKVPTLGDLLAERKGRIFCSNVELGRCRFNRDKTRAMNPIRLPRKYPHRIELHYSTANIFGDTPRERLRDGGFTMSVIALLERADEEALIFDPLVMGSPWLEDPELPYRSIEWHAEEYFEHFVEDIDEFVRVTQLSEVADCEPLRNVSEAAVKCCFAQLLGDSIQQDWGGETSDHYTAHLRLAGRRTTAAFLFKGPANFKPMGLNHLGKNNDQIVRLAREPAELLVVQHCHEILPPVRETLRAFAVQPSRPRRYCLIDGRDTLRVLRAYDLYEKAVAFTAADRKFKKIRKPNG